MSPQLGHAGFLTSYRCSTEETLMFEYSKKREKETKFHIYEPRLRKKQIERAGPPLDWIMEPYPLAPCRL